MKNLVYIFILLIVFSCKEEKEVKDSGFESNVPSTTYVFESVDDVKIFAGSLIRVDSFPSKFITPRSVDIWLPKDYSREKKYSVLYMHDGQMLFDSTTTWNKQEWKVDEWATTLVDDEKTNDFIVVAIHNISKIRWQDLFPEKAFSFLPLEERERLIIEAKKNFINLLDLNGDDYLKFIVEELKPQIDFAYSTKTDRANTFVMGSSMGGLMSMYAISEYPNIFGGAACISTHWIGAAPREDNPFPEAIFKYMEANLPKAGSHKLYFDYGNKTLDQHYPQYAPRVDKLLKAKGYNVTNSKNLFFEGTDHSENSWNKRLDQPLTFLLGN
ncbi:alpha/beta hydrolase-fold protein [Winogradskyella sp.]|uniref:alpha/beta hydrolase n=1 Tax=Winogradskyella sp. TaxID=1883156 RepID=UPI0025F515EA|nr:alpha/beta hydrolase-fold protein [Winogradskyella sp.]